MSVRVFVLAALTLVVGAVTLVAGQMLLGQNAAAPPAPDVAEIQPVFEPEPTTEVLVAADILPMGHLVQRRDMMWQPWPEGDLPVGYVTRDSGIDRDSLQGHVLLQTTHPGEPITAARLVAPGEQGFLAAILSPGHRAVSIPVDDILGVAGLVHPGDRVDLILSHSFSLSAVPDGYSDGHLASETVLIGLRVLAVDQALGRIEEGGEPANTVTVEVTPREAELIGVVRMMGEVSLSLNGVRDPGRHLDDLMEPLRTRAPSRNPDPLHPQERDAFAAASWNGPIRYAQTGPAEQSSAGAATSSTDRWAHLPPASQPTGVHEAGLWIPRTVPETPSLSYGGTLAADASPFIDLPPVALPDEFVDLLSSLSEPTQPSAPEIFRGRPPGPAASVEIP